MKGKDLEKKLIKDPHNVIDDDSTRKLLVQVYLRRVVCSFFHTISSYLCS